MDPHFPESEVLPFDITPKEQQMMDEAIEAAKSAEVVIMVLGGSEVTVREERSRTSLDLPGRQEELLKAVCKLGKPTILVMIDGRASSIKLCKKICTCHSPCMFPGEFCGQAVAETIFGDNNPGVD